MAARICLMVGLGNPGAQYAATRHNVGACFVNYFAQREVISLRQESKFHGYVGQGTYQSYPLKLLIPTTYMNESGRAVQALAHFYKITPEQILVVHDDLDHENGEVRLKIGGGHGGHNGLRDIARCLGNTNFIRLRIGIGHPGHKSQVSHYVLTPPTDRQAEQINQAMDASIAVIDDIIEGKFSQAQQFLHTK